MRRRCRRLSARRHLIARFGNLKHRLPLGGGQAVAGADRPTVVVGEDLAAAPIDHRFDGEGHPFTEFGSEQIEQGGVDRRAAADALDLVGVRSAR